MPKTLTRERTSEIIQEWLDALNSLYSQVEEWCADEGWTCERGAFNAEEPYLEKYQAVALDITTPEGTLCMEPFARDVRIGRGTVEFFAAPTLRRVMLVRNDLQTHKTRTQSPLTDEWRIGTDSGINLPLKWNAENFVLLAKSMLSSE